MQHKILTIILIYLLTSCNELQRNTAQEIDTQKLAIISENKIPKFSFINQDSNIINNNTYQDKIYVVDFIFTTCPTICPKMSNNMSYLQKKLSNKEKILYLSHTINPDYDTPEVLKEYAEKLERNEGADISIWNFVTGKKDDIYEIAKSYLYAVSESQEKETGGFIHSGFFVLVDKKGRIRSSYDTHGNPIGVYDGTSIESVNTLANDIEKLLKE